MLIWQLVLIQVVTFILIVLFLRWLLYGQISRALTKLRKLNQQNLAKEKVLKEELARAKKQAEGEIIRGKTEAKTVKKRLKKESEDEAARILENAHRKAKRIIDAGKRQSQQKMKAMVSQIQEKAAHLACDIIEYIFSEVVQEKLQSQLIDELIDELNSISQENLKVEGSSLEVVSAFELNERQKSKLKDVLFSKLKKKVTLSSSINKAIVAGIILKSGGFVIDGSIKNKLKKVFPIIKEQARQS